MNKRIAKKFKLLERKLEKCFPHSIVEAKKLASNVVDPRTASPTVIWRIIWSKPLFANTKIEIGDASVKRLKPYMKQAWKDWGDKNGNFLIEKNGVGTATESFIAQTNLAQKIRAKTGIAMHRLFAIQGAAQALRERVSQNHLKSRPYKDLIGSDIGLIVPKLKSEMGPGWGHITVLHLLTEMGLACKPDLHLVRAVRYLGMTLDFTDRKVPNLIDAIKINHRVSELVKILYGEVTPENFRYVDKILMDISRRGIIPGSKENDRKKKMEYCRRCS
jgi:hypothetical protein